MALLEVEDLKVYYPVRGGWFRPKRYLRAVDGVSFSLEAGETLGLVGESGCGKSTLGRALVRLENPAAGRVMLDGRDMAALKGRELRRARKNFQMIFQDPYGSLNPRLTIFQALDEVLALHFRLNRAERLERAAALLERVGLTAEALNRYPHQFSGGQRQRIGIARALAAEPRFIAHDLAVVEHISSRILVMYLGHVVEEAPARELVGSPRHPYTQALLSAVPTLDVNGRKRIVLPGDVPSPLSPPSGCPFHPRCPRSQPKCAAEAPPLVSPDGSARRCACFFAG